MSVMAETIKLEDGYEYDKDEKNDETRLRCIWRNQGCRAVIFINSEGQVRIRSKHYHLPGYSLEDGPPLSNYDAMCVSQDGRKPSHPNMKDIVDDVEERRRQRHLETLQRREAAMQKWRDDINNLQTLNEARYMLYKLRAYMYSVRCRSGFHTKKQMESLLEELEDKIIPEKSVNGRELK